MLRGLLCVARCMSVVLFLLRRRDIVVLLTPPKPTMPRMVFLVVADGMFFIWYFSRRQAGVILASQPSRSGFTGYLLFVVGGKGTN